MVNYWTSPWVGTVVQFERKDAGSRSEFMGVWGPARPGNDGESHQTTSEVNAHIILFQTRILLIRSDTLVSRNLFFRVSSLTLMGVKLVFVMEGEAPKLKAETMNKRTEARYGAFKKTSSTSTKTSTSRGRFKAVLKEVSYSCLVPVSIVIHSCLFVLSHLLSVLICWTYWGCHGWLLLGRLRPCALTWTHRAWWTAVSPTMEMLFYTGPRLYTETSIWTVKYVHAESSKQFKRP